MTFYSPEEVIIAHNEKRIDLHAGIKVRIASEEEEGGKAEIITNNCWYEFYSTRLFPEGVGYIDELA